MKRKQQSLGPNNVLFYFRAEWLPLVFVTLSGVF